MKLPRFLLALWLMLALCDPAAAETVVPILTDPGSRISISVAGLLDSTPHAGFAPLRIDVTNDSAVQHAWTISVRAETSARGPYRPLPIETVREIAVPARARRSIHVLVQLSSGVAPGYPGSQHATTWVRGSVAGYGITYGDFTMRSETSTSGKPSFPFSLVSSKLPTDGFDPGRKLYEQLEQISNDVNMSFLGSHIADVGALPADWRTFLAFQNIYLGADEWQQLSFKTRSVLLDWLLQGGNLQLFSATGISRLESLPALSRRETKVGLGTVRLHAQHSLTREAFLEPSGARDVSPLRSALLDVYPSSWSMGARMDSPSIPTWRILILMTFYAVLVGPVNVFKLARDRRYRLYFTTPIMALAASILIFTMILISDGTGGNGRRLVASILLPNENRAIVLQEQIARTGLVLSGSFDFPEDSLLVRVPFEGPFAKSNNMPSSGAYRIAEGRRAGEWFGSRSLQAHVASVIGPSRSRVELTRSDSGELLVTSTVPAVLEKLVYRDKDDRFWTAQNIAPGERKPLTSSNGAPSWIRETYTLGGPAVQRAISSVREHEAYFLALASGSRDLAIRSHPSIAWEEEAAIFMGPVEPLGGRS